MPLSLARVVNPQAGWYRGDFHAHTYCSDGYHSPNKLVEMATAEGLDFLAITDHNIIDAFQEISHETDVLIIPGLEVTLNEGHFNVFGIPGWLDWMEPICIGQLTTSLAGRHRTTTELMQYITTTGLLTSMNHPLLKPWEWRDETTELRFLNCLEIWNDPSWPDNVQANPQAVALWTDALNAGYRLTAIGGSDYHRPAPRPGEDKPAERLGLPSTYVYASELSTSAILAGLRRRAVYVSMGPQVTFQARAGGAVYSIGADLGELRGPIEFSAAVFGYDPAGLVSAWARIEKNGRIVADAPVSGDETRVFYTEPAASAAPAWYRFDVFDQRGQLLAITNPIYVGAPYPPALFTYGDFSGKFTTSKGNTQ
jgi:hypothetical protein